MFARLATTLTALLFAQLAAAEGFYLAGRVGVTSVDDAVSTSLTSGSGPGELPASISLDGRPFDSSDTTLGLVAGWKARSWLALELSYSDLGEAESSIGVLRGPVGQIPATLSPSIRPNTNFLPAAILVPTAAVTIPADANKATVSVTEWSLAARFNARLVSRLSANWTVGISHNEFEAKGSLSILQPTQPAPGFDFVEVPYESPSSETGFNWGLGFEWAFNDRFSADLGYRQHRTGALDVESVQLEFKVSL